MEREHAYRAEYEPAEKAEKKVRLQECHHGLLPSILAPERAMISSRLLSRGLTEASDLQVSY
jgi:hypothetical protein